MNNKTGGGSGLFANLNQDLPASIVVFFVAVPLCLGIALASGAPLFSGIIAGIVGGIIVGAISNSSLGVSGPAAGLTVIVLGAIQDLGTFQTFLVAVVLAGFIQVALGVVKAGIIGYYFPSAVIKGMLSAIGVIIILKQIPHAFGYDADYEGDLSFIQADGGNTFSELLRMLDAITPGAIIICLIALAILLLWEIYVSKLHKIFKLIQGPLVAVVVGIIYQSITSSYFPDFALGPRQLVSVPVASGITDFLGQFTAPDFTQIFRNEVWIVAATIAIVASMESLLSVEATDKLDPMKRSTNTNRELIAQGGGNIISGLIGGLPVTQVIIRSSANIHSGARTKLSAILHGVFLLACVALVPTVLNLVPLSVLAAILFIVGFKLVSPSSVMKMYKLGWAQFLPFVVTILGVVFTDLLIGIGLGMTVAVIVILRNSLNNSHFLNREELNGSRTIQLTLAEEVTFLNKGAILQELNSIPERTKVVIDLSKSVQIDMDVWEIISDFKHGAREKNIEVEIVERATNKKKSNFKPVLEYDEQG